MEVEKFWENLEICLLEIYLKFSGIFFAYKIIFFYSQSEFEHICTIIYWEIYFKRYKFENRFSKACLKIPW